MYDEAIMAECLDEVTKAYLQRANLETVPTAFDPTILVAIIMAVMEMCKKPASELKSSAEPTWSERLIVQSAARRAFREKYGMFGFAKYNGAAAVDAVFDVRKSASEDKIVAFAACCG